MLLPEKVVIAMYLCANLTNTKYDPANNVFIKLELRILLLLRAIENLKRYFQVVQYECDMVVKSQSRWLVSHSATQVSYRVGGIACFQ